MAFLAGSRLATHLPKFEIVQPFDGEKIDCNAYTLSMGEEYYVTPETGLSWWKNKKRALRRRASISEPANAIRGRGESFVIPPGQFAFLLTEERVRIPAHLMGFISLKSQIKFRGLINVSGFHVDPGFEGHLIYSVYNAGPAPIHVARGDPLFLLWLAELDGELDMQYCYNSHPPQNEISTKLVSGVAREVKTIDNLSKRLDILALKINIIWYIGVAGTAFLGLCFMALAILPDSALDSIINFFHGSNGT